MLLDLEVSSSIEINASKEKVWKGLTDPDIIKDYLYGTNTVTDWKVGSEILFQGEWEGKQYRDKGVILQIIPNELISYSYWSGFSGIEDKPENYSTVTYKIEPVGDDKIKFTWVQKGFASEQNYEHSNNGMEEFLKGIKAVIEK
ncbi:MAG: SRPBCC domain-containing protein [Ignavibacteriales bacterium]|nr:SRPBCC domain-containing protein [Ignavibacteriales bacterium]